MAASLITRKACAPCRASRSAAMQSVPMRPVKACSQQTQHQGPIKATTQLMSAMATCGLAASLLLGSISAAHAADLRTLADVTREQFNFVDSNKDGVITKEEISQMAQQVAEDEEFDAPNEELVNFSMRVFDLNQDGKLTTEEMLTGLALDAAVGQDTIDADVVQVFDKDTNGKVDLAEFKPAFGSLGEGGEQLKEYAFKRVDFLTDRDGALDVGELANAVALMRIMVLGY